MALCIVSVSGPGEALPIVDSHEVFEDCTVHFNGTVNVVSGGWLDLRGCEVVMSPSDGDPARIRVLDGGRLSLSASARGNWSRVMAGLEGQGPYIEVAWAMNVSIDHTVFENLGHDSGSGKFHPALKVSNTRDVSVRDSSFEGCMRPLVLNQCDRSRIVRNSFRGSIPLAVEVSYGTDLWVTDNQVVGGDDGIQVLSSSGVRVSRNRILGTSDVGIYIIGGDRIGTEDNILSPAGGWGCVVDTAKLVLMRGDEYRAGSGASDEVSGIRMQMASYVDIGDCTFEDLDTGVLIQTMQGFSSAFNVVHDSTLGGCGEGVVVKSLDNVIRDIRVNDVSVGIAIRELFLGGRSSGNSISGCTITGCDVGVEVMNTSGTTVQAMTLSDNIHDIVIKSSISTIVEEGLHSGGTEAKCLISGADARFVNCTMRGGNVAFSLDGGAEVDVHQSDVQGRGGTAVLRNGSSMQLYNSTHVRLYDVEDDCRLEVHWDVDVHVLAESGRVPSVMCTVKVLDTGGKEVLSRKSGVPGSVLGLDVLELEIARGVERNSTPHELMALLDGPGISTVRSITGYLNITLTIDDVPPDIEVELPTLFELTSGDVEFKGSARDRTSPPTSIEVHVDGELQFTGQQSWRFSIRLEDGMHTVHYSARDDWGNAVEVVSTLFIDSTPPVIELVRPTRESTLTTNRTLEVEGRVHNCSRFSINEVEVELTGDRFREVYHLAIDGVHPFELVASDAFGNVARLRANVTLDTQPPSLELDDIVEVTGEPRVLLSGTTDPQGAKVLVRDCEARVLPGGRFSMFVDLVDGPNAIEVVAVDEAGNERVAMLSIVRDVAVSFRIVFPANGSVVQSELLEVVLEGEEGARYRAEGIEWTEAGAGGRLSLWFVLSPGANVIEISVLDPVGNVAQAELSVNYVPVVTYQEPGPPWGLIIATVAIILITLGLATHGWLRSRGGSSGCLDSE